MANVSHTASSSGISLGAALAVTIDLVEPLPLAVVGDHRRHLRLVLRDLFLVDPLTDSTSRPADEKFE